jgi:signal recognition particle GTPase
MDAIKNLLKQLDNKVPTPFVKRLKGFESLQDRLEVAKKELAEKPDDVDLKDALSEITDYLNDYEEDLIEDLEGLVEAKRIAEDKRSKQAYESRIAQQKEARRIAEEKEAQELEKQKKDSENTEKEKKSYGWTALVLGGILLVGSIGAINIFKNK